MSVNTRNFYEELKEAVFKPVTYTIYNKIDDECYVSFLNKKNNTIYSIDDFVYFDFNLEKKEQFLIKMYNKEYLKNVISLKNALKNINEIKIYVDHDNGILRVIKLKDYII